MYKYIKSNENYEVVELLDILVEYELDGSESNSLSIAASNILPISYDSNNVVNVVVPDQALEDYQDFILNVESIILELNFDIVDTGFGDNGISHYYYLRAIEDNGNLVSSMLYKVRISNHVRTKHRVLKDSNEIRSLGRNKKLIEDNDGNPVKVRFRGIVVNNTTHESYDSAENYVENTLRSIRNKMLNHRN